MPRASSLEPVLAISLSTVAASVDCHAKNLATKGKDANTRAIGEKNWPANPLNPNKAPFKLTSALGVIA